MSQTERLSLDLHSLAVSYLRPSVDRFTAESLADEIVPRVLKAAEPVVELYRLANQFLCQHWAQQRQLGRIMPKSSVQFWLCE